MKKGCIFLLVSLISISGGELFAQVNSGEFLRMGVGARPLGLGGSFVAVCDQPCAVYWNPAGLSQFGGLSLEGMYTNQFADGIGNSFLSFSYTPRRKKDGYYNLGFGMGVIITNKGNIPIITLDSGNPTISDYTSLNQTAVFLSSSYRIIERTYGSGDFNYGLTTGVTIKSISSKLHTVRNQGIGVDTGLLYNSKITPSLDLKLGLNAVNIIRPVLGSETLGNYLRWGVAAIYRKSNYNVIISFGSSGISSDYGLECEIGGRYVLRVGRRGESEDINIGGGIVFEISKSKIAQLDYTYTLHELGNSHRFSLSLYSDRLRTK